VHVHVHVRVRVRVYILLDVAEQVKSLNLKNTKWNGWR